MNITNIPAPRVDFIDERTGLMAREWYRFFLNLFQLVGSGTSDTSLVDLQITPIADKYDLILQALDDVSKNPAFPQKDSRQERYNRVLTWLSTIQ